MTTAASLNRPQPTISSPESVNISDWLMIGSALSTSSAVVVMALALTGRVSFTKPFSASVISAIVLGILGAICKDQKIDVTPFFSAANAFIPTFRYLREGSTFESNSQKYYIAYTVGDGACGMHAFLGSKATPSSYYALNVPNVRGHYTDALTAQMRSPTIQQKWEEWMVHFIKDYLSNPYGFYTSMVFSNVDVNPLKVSFQELEQRKLLLMGQQKELFKKAKEDTTTNPIVMRKLDELIVEEEKYLEVEKRQEHTDHLRHRLVEDAFVYQRMTEGLESIIPTIQHLPIGQQIEQNLRALKVLDAERTDIYVRFIRQESIMQAYIQGVSKSAYYFSTQELGLMAHLFNQRIHVYHEINGVPSLELDEGDQSQAPVVVFHAGIHFSRCEPRSE